MQTTGITHLPHCRVTDPTRVAQMTEARRPVGCHPLGSSPSRLSPGWFVAQMIVDPLSYGSVREL